MRQHEEFCEDIPVVSESVFIMEFLHDGLREMPVDFRIIKDTQNLGRFAKLEDIQKIEDIEKPTVHYQAPQLGRDGLLMALHTFSEQGDYIGIVTAKNPSNEKKYIAVFPFQVGISNLGYFPLFIGIAIFVQLNYWLMSSGYSKIRHYLKHEI